MCPKPTQWWCLGIAAPLSYMCLSLRQPGEHLLVRIPARNVSTSGFGPWVKFNESWLQKSELSLLSLFWVLPVGVRVGLAPSSRDRNMRRAPKSQDLWLGVAVLWKHKYPSDLSPSCSVSRYFPLIQFSSGWKAVMPFGAATSAQLHREQGQEGRDESRGQ